MTPRSYPALFMALLFAAWAVLTLVVSYLVSFFHLPTGLHGLCTVLAVGAVGYVQAKITQR